MSGNGTCTGVSVGRDLHAHDINVNIITPTDPPPKNVRFKVETAIQTFTGRETFLEELHKVVMERQVTVLTQEPLSVVAATGGIGKTETVRRYIQLHGHEYDHIIWIDAEDKSFAQRQFLQLATELKISTDFEGKQKEFESILKEIFGKLLVYAHVVLLVFDNAEAMDDDEELSLSGIRSLRPTSLSPFFVEPTIIVTSRNQNWSHQKVIQLDLWTEAEVITFVTVQLNLGKKSESTTLALQLGNLFGRLPIALQAAVAVILQQIKRGKKYGIQSLIDEYESGSRKVLTQKPSDANKHNNMGETMLVLWNISLEKILRYENGELAIKILCFMAYMSQTRIPKDFLFALCKNSCTEDSFENALEILGDYSLIASLNSDDSDYRSFSIHRMIQDSTIENLRASINKGQTPNTIFKETTFLNETEVLLKLSSESVNFLRTFTPLTFARSGELVETLIQITNHVSGKLDVEEFRDLTEKTAKVLLMTSNFPKSIELLERVLAATPSRNWIEISKRIVLGQALADAYHEGGYGQKSLDWNMKTLKILTIVFGPDDECTLDKKCDVARALSNAGRVDEATKMEQEALESYENNGHTQGASYVLLKTTCASRLIDKEERRVAMELLVETLKKQEKNPDLNSGFIKATQLAIRAILRREDRFKELQKFILQKIEDDTKRFGSFGMTTLQNRQAYALTLHQQGKHDLAAPLLLELLETLETQLIGADHPFTLDTKVLLAKVFLATKELDKAEALLDVEVMERVFGPEHPETLGAATVLSDVKVEQEKFTDALALLQKVLEVRRKVLGPNHKDTLSTMYTIGKLYIELKENEKAASNLRELLETEETQLGSDNSSILKRKLFLAQAYLAMKELYKAEALLNVEVMEKVFGPEHPETLGAATVLSKVKEEQGKFQEALALHHKVLRVRKNVVAPNNEDTWKTMRNIVTLYVKMKEYKEAAKVTQELLERKEEVLGKDHPQAIKTLKYLTTCRQIVDLIDLKTMEFMAVTSDDAETAEFFLSASDWDLEAALKAFFDSKSNEDIADLNLEGQALILSAAATDAENQNVARSSPDTADLNLQDQPLILSEVGTAAENQNVGVAPAPCNETEVSQIQDVEVQVESVAVTDQPTTSILFCLAGGTRFRGQFGVSSTVRDLYKFVNEKRPDLVNSDYVLTLYPNIQLTKMEQTLEEAKIPKNVALTLKKLH